MNRLTRDGPTRLARPNYQAREGVGKHVFPSSADQEQNWQPYPLIYTLLKVLTIQTHTVPSPYVKVSEYNL